MNLFKAVLVKFFFPVLLALISCILIFTNHTPHTFLSGWDTLHPEFNFPLAFDRMIHGVWRSDQGLGTVAIQSHMADLPRIFMVWLLSFILPLDVLRYATMLFALFVGPLGIYFLAKSVLKNSYKNALAFLAGLSYLCSLGTVQHFIVPLEMFAFHYAFVPWAFLTIQSYLHHGSRKRLFLYFITSILLIPQAHTATLFYAYFISIFLYMTGMWVIKRSKHIILRILMITLITFLVNAYWILPNLYTVSHHAKEMRESRINRFFTKEAFAKNQLFGTPQNAAILKNFLFDWKLYDFNKKESVDVTGPWVNHAKNPIVLAFGYGIFTTALIGIFGVFKNKKTYALPFALPAATAFLLLLNGTFPITAFFSLLGNLSETAKEAIRFPFTKFSILFMLGLSIYFALGLEFITSLVKKRILNYIFIAILTIGFGYYFYPAFKGELVSPAMRIQIPNEYFDMFKWFQSKPQYDRVAILPIHSFWGWAYYSWGYQGAGFLQFGIPQPILDRDHDRWSQDNEQYQREMQYALYSHNITLIEEVLEKYKVRYILFDSSITNVAGPERETLSWYIPDILKSSSKISLAKEFGPNISIYEYRTTNPSLSELYTSMPDAGPKMIGDVYDRIYSELGPYVTINSKNFDPERAKFSYDERYLDAPQEPILNLINSASDLPPVQKCSQSTIQATRTLEDGVIRYESTNGPLCDYLAFPDASHEKAYILEIKSRSINGFPLQVYICNNLTDHCHQTIHLHSENSFNTERFIIPPFYDFGVGYTVNISNFAIHTKTSINELKEVTFREYNPAPFIPSEPNAEFSESGQILAFEPGSTILRIHPQQTQQTLVYNERFHTGWNAYHSLSQSKITASIQKIFPSFGATKIKIHTKANNWANAWILPQEIGEPVVVRIVFVPQILQNLGFILFLLTSLLFVKFANPLSAFMELDRRFQVRTNSLKSKIKKEIS